MYKLNIGVGASVIRQNYIPHNSKSFIMDIVQQHKIILSEKIIHYYEILEENDFYKEALVTYIDTISNVDSTHVFYESLGDNVSPKEELIYYVKRNPMSVLLSEQEEFSDIDIKGINLVTPQNMIDCKMTPLFKYSFPISNLVVEKGENCIEYAKWFGHLMEEEDQIEIQDKYVLSHKGVRSLKKYYFPFIKKGTTVNIFCELVNNDSINEIVGRANDPFFDDWDLHVFLCEEMHDRIIQFGDLQISIGVGLDFLAPSGRTRKRCIITITNRKSRIKKPKVKCCIK